MRAAVRTAVVGALSLVAAGGAEAQLAERRVTVTPYVGTIRWDDASALANKRAGDDGEFTENVITPTIGLSADYNIFRGIGLGLYFEAARPETRGDYFPAAIFDYGSRVELYNVSQRVTVLMYGAQASYTFPFAGRLLPYVTGGLGAVTVNADPQQSNQNASFTDPSFQLGGGVGWNFGGNKSVRLDVRNYTFTDWDRTKLNPVQTQYQNTRFPEANGTPPDEKKTVNNFRIAIGFSYVPSRGGNEGNTDDGDEPTTTQTP